MNTRIAVIFSFFLLLTSLRINGQIECRAIFSYSGTGNSCGIGTFTLYDNLGMLVMDNEKASSGNTWAANNSEYVSFEDIGAIPPGKYRITIKDTVKNIFFLRPLDKTKMYKRSGFLIHGFKNDQSPEAASKGCIILDGNKRRKIREVLNMCKEIELHVLIY